MSRPRLVLASSSPRRRALLEALGLRFTVFVPDVDEQPRPGEQPRRLARRLAILKARRVAHSYPPTTFVLAADTVVALGRVCLGKPRDAATNHAQLARLSGRVHEVHTAVALAVGGRLRTRTSTSRLRFRPLTTAEIDRYVRTGEGLDKAGGYALQGQAMGFVLSFEGSPSGVVGLPVSETLALLRAAGFPESP